MFKIKAIKRLFYSLVEKRSRKQIRDTENHFEKLFQNLKSIHEKTIKTMEADSDERVATIQRMAETQIRKLEKSYSNEIATLNRSHLKNREALEASARKFSASNEILFEIDQLYKIHTSELYDELKRRRKASEDLIATLIRSNSGIDEMMRDFEFKLKAKRKKLANKLHTGEEE